MDKVHIVGIEDPFREQKHVYQANGYYNGLGELSYSHLTRFMCEAKTFKSKKEASNFMEERFYRPEVTKIIPISKKEMFKLKLMRC